MGEAGRRDRASRLACLSLAGLSWSTTGLSLGSPRRWQGARTSAGGWETPRVAASRSSRHFATERHARPRFPSHGPPADAENGVGAVMFSRSRL